MPCNDHLAERIRQLLSTPSDVEEKRMFGGLTFMVGGKMCCGVRGDDLMVRVEPDYYPEYHREALGRPHARPMDFTGRPMRGFVFVSADGLAEDDDLENWVGHGVEFASSLGS